MATHRISLLRSGTMPDTSGNVFPESFSIKATNDVWLLDIIVFNDTATRIGLHGGFKVPKNYVGSAKLIATWTATATSGNVVWDFDYRAVSGNDAESLDQTGTQESVSVTDAAPGAALRKLDAEVALSSGNFAADDFVTFTLFRDGADAGDTMAAAALLFDLEFEYADS